jgi:hypothetical protein
MHSPFEKWRLKCIPQVGFNSEIRELLALAFEGGKQSALEQPAQELEAYLRSALDNARDVCKYLDHDMVEKAKTHTQFFWDDLDKIRELDND